MESGAPLVVQSDDGQGQQTIVIRLMQPTPGANGQTQCMPISVHAIPLYIMPQPQPQQQQQQQQPPVDQQSLSSNRNHGYSTRAQPEGQYQREARTTEDFSVPPGRDGGRSNGNKRCRQVCYKVEYMLCPEDALYCQPTEPNAGNQFGDVRGEAPCCNQYCMDYQDPQAEQDFTYAMENIPRKCGKCRCGPSTAQEGTIPDKSQDVQWDQNIAQTSREENTENYDQMEQKTEDGYRRDQKTEEGYRKDQKTEDGYQRDQKTEEGYRKNQKTDDGYRKDQKTDDGYRKDQKTDDGYRKDQKTEDGYRRDQKTQDGYRKDQSTNTNAQECPASPNLEYIKTLCETLGRAMVACATAAAEAAEARGKVSANLGLSASNWATAPSLLMQQTPMKTDDSACCRDSEQSITVENINPEVTNKRGEAPADAAADELNQTAEKSSVESIGAIGSQSSMDSPGKRSSYTLRSIQQQLDMSHSKFRDMQHSSKVAPVNKDSKQSSGSSDDSAKQRNSTPRGSTQTARSSVSASERKSCGSACASEGKKSSPSGSNQSVLSSNIAKERKKSSSRVSNQSVLSSGIATEKKSSPSGSNQSVLSSDIAKEKKKSSFRDSNQSVLSSGIAKERKKSSPRCSDSGRAVRSTRSSVSASERKSCGPDTTSERKNERPLAIATEGKSSRRGSTATTDRKNSRRSSSQSTGSAAKRNSSASSRKVSSGVKPGGTRCPSSCPQSTQVMSQARKAKSPSPSPEKRREFITSVNKSQRPMTLKSLKCCTPCKYISYCCCNRPPNPPKPLGNCCRNGGFPPWYC